MRLFLAIYPSDKSISQWRSFQRNAAVGPLRWTPEESLHVTLKFFGEVDDHREKKILAALPKIVSDFSPFELQLKSGGVFPSKGSPSVFWVGLDHDTRVLEELVHVLDLECKNLGFAADDHDYHPHLTVARTSNNAAKLPAAFGRDFKKWVEPFETEPFVVNELCLVQSQLGGTGSKYLVRDTFPLRGHS